MEPSAPLEDVTRGCCVSCLFSGQVFEGHMKIGKKQLKGRFLIHGSTVHIHTGEDVKFRTLGTRQWTISGSGSPGSIHNT